LAAYGLLSDDEGEDYVAPLAPAASSSCGKQLLGSWQGSDTPLGHGPTWARRSSGIFGEAAIPPWTNVWWIVHPITLWTFAYMSCTYSISVVPHSLVVFV
jgi:hypothetical protein